VAEADTGGAAQIVRSKAVRLILKGVAQGKREQILTGHGAILVLAERFAPWLIRAVARRLAARPRA